MIKETLKLDLAVSKNELRPMMTYILVTKENVVVTDGYILVALDTAEVFDKEDIDNFKHDTFYIKGEDWEHFKENGIIEWLGDDVIKIEQGKRRALVQVFNQDNIEGKYPNWQNVIPNPDDYDYTAKELAFKSDLLDIISKCLPKEAVDNGVKLTLSGLNKAILVERANENWKSKAVIMPIIIKNNK